MLYINNDNIREVKNDLRVAANHLLKWFEINIEKMKLFAKNFYGMA